MTIQRRTTQTTAKSGPPAGKGGGANRPNPEQPTKGPSKSKASASAQALAAQVFASAEARGVAAAVEHDLPAVMQAVLDGAKVAGTSGRADREMLAKLLQLPGFKGAQPAAARQTDLRDLTRRLEAQLGSAGGRGDARLEGRPVVDVAPDGSLAPPAAPPKQALPALPGRVGGTVPALNGRKLPF